MKSLEKWMILTPLPKLPNNVGDLGKIIVATSFEWLPKVQKIAKSGHTDPDLCIIYLSQAIPTYIPSKTFPGFKHPNYLGTLSNHYPSFKHCLPMFQVLPIHASRSLTTYIFSIS